MTSMHWEPMTEDAVFEDYEEVLVWSGGPFIMYYRLGDENAFKDDDGMTWPRRYITHFARITNPNEEKP